MTPAAGQEQRGDRREGRLHDRAFAPGEVTHVGEREALLLRDAQRDAVRVDVREPEDRCRDDDEGGDDARLVRVGLGADDDHRQHDEGAVDEARKALVRPCGPGARVVDGGRGVHRA
jgi:hypothetical protein